MIAILVTASSKPVTLYAAYGTNLDPEQMHERCPHSPVVGSGWLEGYRIAFGAEDLGWEGALATVVEEAGQHVFVVLYDVTDEDVRALDSMEGADTGLYSKIRVRVHTLTSDEAGRLAWIYVLNAYEGGLPGARYLGLMAEAAELAGAPADYVRELRERPCS
jgi:gamma-glutamylcyclotransferase (GGCT)/AIG2-like uncharacterized protein YtfP